MSQERTTGGRPGTDHDEAWWARVHALLDEAFPGLPAAIARAEKVGARWAEISTPFVLFEGERPVCHVGVIDHPLLLNGEIRPVAGLHAVCTAADRRRRGYARRTLKAALAWVDERFELAKLHTDDPGVYTGHGFRALPTCRFTSSVAPHLGVARRRLHPSESSEDAALLRRLLAERAPVSERCATADPGWMVTIDAALSGALDGSLYHLPEHDAVVAFGEEEGRALVAEVIAPRLPPAEVVLGAAPTLDSSPPAPAPRWAFCPDLLDPGARPVEAPAAVGTFMVRGAWPEVGPIGLSPLWEH